MTKKLSGLSRREKLPKKKARNTLNTEHRVEKELKKLVCMDDEQIDFSDIAELDFDKLGKPTVGKFYRPMKKPISIRIDADVLDWFKAHDHYQRLINKACRLYMLGQLSKRKHR